MMNIESISKQRLSISIQIFQSSAFFFLNFLWIFELSIFSIQNSILYFALVSLLVSLLVSMIERCLRNVILLAILDIQKNYILNHE